MNDLDILTLSVVNFHVEARKVESNLNRIIGFTKAAAKQGSEMIIFPELAISGYDVFIDDNANYEEKTAVAEAINDSVIKRIADVAKKYEIVIVFGMPKKIDDQFYNVATYISEKGEISCYCKIHPFGAENKFFEKGSKPLIINTKWGKIGICICYDTYQFPELLRMYVSKGCRLVINPTAMVEEIKINGSRESFEHYYIKSLEYAVFCNGIYIASSNLTGYDEMNYFGGASGIFGPKVTPFAEVDSHIYAGGIDNVQESVITQTIDLSLADRRLFSNNSITGESDYRAELYKTLIGS